MAVILHGAHILAVLFWVGGMAFAYLILRPAAGPLEAGERMTLWQRVFSRFLPWVGVAIIALLVSGFGMIFLEFDGFAGLPIYVNLMMATGILMMLLYLHLLFAPWKRFRAAVETRNISDAGAQLARIRTTVGINLAIGIFTLIVGSTGPYW